MLQHIDYLNAYKINPESSYLASISHNLPTVNAIQSFRSRSMIPCNTSIAWKHFRKSFRFTACGSKKRWAVDSPVLRDRGSQRTSTCARNYGTRRSGIDGQSVRPEVSKPYDRLNAELQKKSTIANGSTEGLLRDASSIASFRRIMSERHLVDTPQGLQMCTVLTASPQTTVRATLL